jgi:hypothetical protein
MRSRIVLMFGLGAIGGCALDSAGAQPGAGGGSSSAEVATSIATGGPGSTSSGSTSGQGGESAGSTGDGGASTGAGGSISQGGSGGDDGGGGSGGAGGQGGGVGGEGGEGGAAPLCGNGRLEDGEECETQEDGDDCEDSSCQWLGSCGDDITRSFVPGGLFATGDTTEAPSVADFGACQDNGAAPVQLHAYTTGPEPAFLEVRVGQDPAGLANPILSLHTRCTDPTLLDCRIPGGPCCVDAAAGVDELLVSTLLPPFTTVEVAVSGFQGDDGAYDIEFRELRNLLEEDFDAGLGEFTIESGWSAIGTCPGVAGTPCVGIVGDATHPDENLISPSFSAENVGVVFLRWHHSCDNSLGNLNDQQTIEVSIDGGTQWTEVYAQGQEQDEDDVAKEVDISVVAGEPDVRLRWHYADGGGADFYWYVDDVVVTGW